MTHDLCIVSDGGHISIKYLQAKGLAYLSSNGGNVEIQGLDGNATISTNGGNLRLQLLENAKEVKIDSGDGEVTLWMTSEENVNVEHVNDHEKHAKGNLHTEKENVLAGRTEANLQRCNVLILGSGTVVTKKRSWIEAVMQNRSI
ncbi:hypothetical protein KP509_26G040200 [Ceratopteris richardii]|uniref:DUF4097 domain-containing protein n=1 Tax=Ceratopteris richardii TaxID=49495 RepID=A0A8T2RK68_CERRI|nr:hypothetical protein KP509_26G040200 [Ceratopteris richardii]